jgi:hypothetical protein
MTEWLMDTPWEDVQDYVITLCKETRIDIINHGTGPWTPVRIEKEIV